MTDPIYDMEDVDNQLWASDPRTKNLSDALAKATARIKEWDNSGPIIAAHREGRRDALKLAIRVAKQFTTQAGDSDADEIVKTLEAVYNGIH